MASYTRQSSFAEDVQSLKNSLDANIAGQITPTSISKTLVA
jgi:hypothetical protein